MPLPLVLRLLGAVAMLAGLLHLGLGPGADVMLGAHIPPQVVADPVLDSQNRFYGVSFIGYGALLLLCATDIRKYSAVLRIVGAFVFLGGLARVLVIYLRGLPSVPVLGLTIIELVGVPLLLGWHARVKSKEESVLF
jgi:hypothetical protein